MAPEVAQVPRVAPEVAQVPRVAPEVAQVPRVVPEVAQVPRVAPEVLRFRVVPKWLRFREWLRKCSGFELAEVAPKVARVARKGGRFRKWFGFREWLRLWRDKVSFTDHVNSEADKAATSGAGTKKMIHLFSHLQKWND